MGGFSSSLGSSGGGADTSSYDPAQYLGGGQSQGDAQAGQPPQGQGASQTGTSPDFVQSIGRMGMQLEQQIDALAGQFPEGAEEARTAKMALKKLIAKVLTTNPKASGGPMAPRTA